jgi:UDP-N-acetylmuramyl tripeptide synthase
MNFDVNYRGFYNIYNILASFAAYEACGRDACDAHEVFLNYKPQIGRMEPFVIEGKKVILNLSKNAAGFNQAISTLISDTKKKDLFIAFNDNPSDGTDISWIWDVDFENLMNANVNSITVSGMRKDDMALRLKHAGFENVKTSENSRETLLSVIKTDGEICYVLVNYTALFDTQNNLKSMEDK